MKPNLPTSNSLEELLHIVSNPEVFQTRVTELKSLNLQLAQRLNDLGMVDEVHAMELRAQAKLDEAKSVREQADEYAKVVRSTTDAYKIDESAKLRSREERVFSLEHELDVYKADLEAKRIALDKSEAKVKQQELELAQLNEYLKRQRDELAQKRSYIETGIKKLQDFIANG